MLSLARRGAITVLATAVLLVALAGVAFATFDLPALTEFKQTWFADPRSRPSG